MRHYIQALFLMGSFLFSHASFAETVLLRCPVLPKDAAEMTLEKNQNKWSVSQFTLDSIKGAIASQMWTGKAPTLHQIDCEGLNQDHFGTFDVAACYMRLGPDAGISYKVVFNKVSKRFILETQPRGPTGGGKIETTRCQIVPQFHMIAPSGPPAPSGFSVGS